MEAVWIVGLIVAGLVLGSFVSALVWRLHAGRDWVTERSECSHCHHLLGPLDLIPVVSWLLLKGKCRYCHKKIEDSPWVELALAGLFALSYVAWPVALRGVGLYEFIFWLLFLVGFMALVVYDLRWMILPDGIVFKLVGLALIEVAGMVVLYHFDISQVMSKIAGGIVLSGLFYVIFQVSKGEWIGGGDVKLAIVLGILAGDPLRSTLLLFCASLLGLIAAVPQIMQKKSESLTLKIPFGPFLIGGLIIVQLFGTPLISWYVGLFA